jgi:hypothetical protein
LLVQVCAPWNTKRYFKGYYLVGCLAPGSYPGSYNEGPPAYPFYRRRQRRAQVYSHPEVEVGVEQEEALTGRGRPA